MDHVVRRDDPDLGISAYEYNYFLDRSHLLDRVLLLAFAVGRTLGQDSWARF